MGGTFLSPVFSAHLGENKSDKLRGLGQSPNHAVRISPKRSSKNIINCPISEQDIQISGVYVDNPLIGALPSPIEIKNELDNLIEPQE